MRVAFLGHDQSTDGAVQPSGGYIRRSEAEALVRSLMAERISQKKIRAFPPHSSFNHLRPGSSSSLVRLAPIEVGNCRFVPPRNERASGIIRSRPAVKYIRERWDWSKERWDHKAAGLRIGMKEELTA